ncbi:hypothetical protein CLOM_g21657 [Closterium sp. NIES-68]|nr:hypothetical protein CLOM_g21657 [Closterium sp. NIES-68]GJP58801.1 hypothetical protein CLOP_g3599 [Closterium sp. NIES-67]
MAAASPSCARGREGCSRPRSPSLSPRRSPSPGSAEAAAAFSCRAAASPRLLALLLLLSLAVSRIHGRAPAADVRHHSQVAGVADLQSESQSSGVGASRFRQHGPPASIGGEAAVGATGARSDGAAGAAIGEWLRRSADAGAQFFPLQRAEDAPSREELHRRILQGSGMIGGGLKGKGGSRKASNETGFLPTLEYGSTLVSMANGSLGNTFVNYSTFADDNKIRLPVFPYYVDLKLGSMRQQFKMALNIFLPFTWVPCDCLHCGTARRGTASSKPFSTLSSSSLSFISCADNRCLEGSKLGYYGCNADGTPNYLNTTGLLPGDDALCVYTSFEGYFDYYEADADAGEYIGSVGHVIEDTVYLTAPDGTEVNRSITFGCGLNQQGYWGMQGWLDGSWTAGGVLGLGYRSPFLEQLTTGTRSFAVCLDQPTPTNKPAWDEKRPLQEGSSHLTIGAVGLPAGAQYSRLFYSSGMRYSHITLTTTTRAMNITDDPSSLPKGTAFLPEDAPGPPGFLFMPESFVHMLRASLLISFISNLQEMTGQTFIFNTTTKEVYRLPCFQNKKNSGDPFTVFPTVDIAFYGRSSNGTSPASHFYLKPSEYLVKVSPSRYCVLATSLPPDSFYANYIGEPGLFNKYLFFDYTNATAGWIDAPQCGATPQIPPPSPPPPPSPVSKAALASRSLAAAAVRAVITTTSTALLALSLL